MRHVLLVLAAALLASCDSPPPVTARPVHAEVASASIAAVPSASASAAAPPTGPRPPLDLACTRDADCAVSSTDVSGASTCCPGCAWHAATKSSLAAFARSCERTPASSCPALGCAMPLMVAKCVAAQCVGVIGP